MSRETESVVRTLNCSASANSLTQTEAAAGEKNPSPAFCPPVVLPLPLNKPPNLQRRLPDGRLKARTDVTRSFLFLCACFMCYEGGIQVLSGSVLRVVPNMSSSNRTSGLGSGTMWLCSLCCVLQRSSCLSLSSAASELKHKTVVHQVLDRCSWRSLSSSKGHLHQNIIEKHESLKRFSESPRGNNDWTSGLKPDVHSHIPLPVHPLQRSWVKCLARGHFSEGGRRSVGCCCPLLVTFHLRTKTNKVQRKTNVCGVLTLLSEGSRTPQLACCVAM